MLSLREMTSKTCLHGVAGLLLTGLLALGLHRLADGLSGSVDGLLLAEDCGGKICPGPNSGQNEKDKPPPPPDPNNLISNERVG